MASSSSSGCGEDYSSVDLNPSNHSLSELEQFAQINHNNQSKLKNRTTLNRPINISNNTGSDSEAESFFSSFSLSSSERESVVQLSEQSAILNNLGQTSSSLLKAPPPPTMTLESFLQKSKESTLQPNNTKYTENNYNSKKSDFYFDERNLRVTKEDLNSEIPIGSAATRIAAFKKFQTTLTNEYPQQITKNNYFPTTLSKSNSINKNYQNNLHETMKPSKFFKIQIFFKNCIVSIL